MKTYLLKWSSAGLIWPLFYLATFQFINWSQEAVLLFWPTSIMLMALGSEPNDILQVTQVYLASILSNMLVFLILGLLIKALMALYKYSNKANT